MIRPTPVVLTIVSGFGMSPVLQGNAIKAARLPVFSHLIETYPAMTLHASGAFVGLEDNACGSSRAGCLTIGAGRPVLAPCTRLHDAATARAFGKVPALRRAGEHAQTHTGAVHLIGQFDGQSDRVHAILSALLTAAQDWNVTRVFLHVILSDDITTSDQVRECVALIASHVKTAGIGKIASISGSFFAGDTRHEWERVKLAYDAMANGTPVGVPGSDSDDHHAVAGVLPCSIDGERIRPGDACIFFDQDPRQIRELVTAFALPTFNAFTRTYIPNLRIVTLVETDVDLPIETAFPTTLVEHTMGTALSDAGLRQLRIAETEGFVSVTAGLNGGISASPGEDRLIIPSPTVSRVERVPEMSSVTVADRVVKEIAYGRYDVIIAYLPAPDRVAQSGDETATIKACEAVDRAIGRIAEATLALDGILLLTSDHGNAEAINDRVKSVDGEITGTCHPVPFVVVGRAHEGLKARFGDLIGGDLSLSTPSGTLADIAPTMLGMLNVPIPKEMTGTSLV